jgi:hypothetical protein
VDPCRLLLDAGISALAWIIAVVVGSFFGTSPHDDKPWLVRWATRGSSCFEHSSVGPDCFSGIRDPEFIHR